MPDIFFVRHGQTDWNLEGRFQGKSDIPLNETGLAQARTIARNLSDWLKRNSLEPNDLELLSSPLLRAHRTAQIIAEYLHRDAGPISTMTVLREVSYGAWEGLTTLEVKERFPDQRRSRKADRWNYCPPDGESHASRLPELKAFLSGLKSPAVIVTHTGVIRLCLYLLGCLGQAAALSEPISQDKIYVFSKGSLARI
ncbi:histidine phosphatase family protein [Hoeflea sp.]|uniref:histidine phosphatase family protein n=1 Tax=Hoeflea sp. TaxID=1940281 RepID=UPI003B018914